MITKEQLQAMSDFDVTLALAKLVCKTHITYTRGDGEMVCVDNMKVDYCNTPNDIMPLAFEHRIQLMPFQDCVGTDWFADQIFNSSPDSAYSDTNPLRAIACCLILVLQEKQK